MSNGYHRNTLPYSCSDLKLLKKTLKKVTLEAINYVTALMIEMLQ